MDLYYLAVCFFAILLLLTLISLKYSLRQVSVRESIAQSQQKQKLIDQNQVCLKQKEYCFRYRSTLVYLLKNYTLAEFILMRQASRKMYFLFNAACIGILSFFIPTFYCLSITGSIISSAILGLEVYFFSKRQNEEIQEFTNNKQQKNYRNERILCITLGSISIAIYLYLLFSTYKRYQNSFLQSFLKNFGLNLAIDSIALRPIAFVMSSIILCKSQNLLLMILKSNQEVLSNRVSNSNSGAVQTIQKMEIQPTEGGLKSKRRRPKHKLPPISNYNSVNQSKIIAVNQEKSCQKLFHLNENFKSISNIDKEITQQIPVQSNLQSKTKSNSFQKGYFCLNLRKPKTEIQTDFHQKIENEDFIDTNSKQLKKNIQDIDQPCIFQESESIPVIEESNAEMQKSSGVKAKSAMKINHKAELPDFQEEKPEHSNHYSSKTHQLKGRQVYNSQKNRRFMFNKVTTALKISQQIPHFGDLEEIDLNSPEKQKQFFENSVEAIDKGIKKLKKHKRRASKAQIKSDYINNAKLSETIDEKVKHSDFSFCESNESKAKHDTFFKSNKKRRKGRDRPIVHENDENKPAFFIPNL